MSDVFSDAVIAFLKEKQISSDAVAKLRNYLELEEFDTDSIYLDIDKDSNGYITGNIANAMDDEDIMISIVYFLQSNKS